MGQAARAIFGLSILAALAAVAFLYVTSLPTCACGMAPAQTIALVATGEPRAYEVVSASPELAYGEMDALVDDSLVSMTQESMPRYGEWNARRGGTMLARSDDVLAGDVVTFAGPGSSLKILDRTANSYMLHITMRDEGRG